jgi:hypothetical protein
MLYIGFPQLLPVVEHPQIIGSTKFCSPVESRRKARYKSPFLACQLSVFFAPARYRMTKIMRSYSEVVL